MRFRHLDYSSETPVAALGPAAIDALLERGDIEAWTPLLRSVEEDPWGATADTVLRLCEAHPMYGTSTLWRTWIERRRGRPGRGGTTLAEARRRAGLTQTEVAERLGIGQSDVSKLERRSDVLLSTLRAYAEAIEARLEVGFRDAGDEVPRPIVLLSRSSARRGERG